MKIHNGRFSINSSASIILLIIYTAYLNKNGKEMIWLCMSVTHSFNHTYNVYWVLIQQQNKTLKVKWKEM